jgi:hypothetical protein
MISAHCLVSKSGCAGILTRGAGAFAATRRGGVTGASVGKEGFFFSPVSVGLSDGKTGATVGVSVTTGFSTALEGLFLASSLLQLIRNKQLTKLKNKTFVFLNIAQIEVCFGMINEQGKFIIFF